MDLRVSRIIVFVFLEKKYDLAFDREIKWERGRVSRLQSLAWRDNHTITMMSEEGGKPNR